jgi:hypothetical protein
MHSFCMRHRVTRCASSSPHPVPRFPSQCLDRHGDEFLALVRLRSRAYLCLGLAKQVSVAITPLPLGGRYRCSTSTSTSATAAAGAAGDRGDLGETGGLEEPFVPDEDSLFAEDKDASLFPPADQAGWRCGRFRPTLRRVGPSGVLFERTEHPTVFPLLEPPPPRGGWAGALVGVVRGGARFGIAVEAQPRRCETPVCMAAGSVSCRRQDLSRAEMLQRLRSGH